MQNEEEEILALIDAQEHNESSSATPYDELFTLFSETRNNIKPDTALLQEILEKLSTQNKTSTPRVALISSPYIGTVNWLFAQTTSWKFATPVIVLFLAVATIIGVNPKKTGTPTPSLATNEVIAPTTVNLTGGNAEPSTFAMTDSALPEATQNPMMMAKMSMTTLPSSTPQNVGELIALLSNEADVDMNLGASDINDPLYSVNSADVDAIQLSYDTATI